MWELAKEKSFVKLDRNLMKSGEKWKFICLFDLFSIHVKILLLSN